MAAPPPGAPQPPTHPHAPIPRAVPRPAAGKLCLCSAPGQPDLHPGRASLWCANGAHCGLPCRGERPSPGAAVLSVTSAQQSQSIGSGAATAALFSWCWCVLHRVPTVGHTYAPLCCWHAYCSLALRFNVRACFRPARPPVVVMCSPPTAALDLSAAPLPPSLPPLAPPPPPRSAGTLEPGLQRGGVQRQSDAGAAAGKRAQGTAAPPCAAARAVPLLWKVGRIFQPLSHPCTAGSRLVD